MSGEVEWLTAPPIDFTIGSQRRQRFSEIVPTNPLLLIAFRMLRLMFGENGRASDWTRQWRCEWIGIILIESNRGRTMVSRSRQAIVDWEHELFCKPKFEL